MKFIRLIFLLSFSTTGLFAQVDNIGVNRIRQTLSVANNVTPVPTGMRTVPLQAAELEGSYYLQEDYTPTKFILSTDESISDVPARYNVRTNVFIINANNTFGALRGGLVKEFSFFEGEENKRYVSSSVLPFNPFIAGSGFYNILFEGNDVMLVGKTTYDIIPSNYNIALDVGERKSYIKLATDYFMLENSNYKQLKKFTNKNLAVFGNKKSEIKKFIESENLSHKVEKDLIRIVSHYQSLLSN